jgi:hypothetical protein
MRRLRESGYIDYPEGDGQRGLPIQDTLAGGNKHVPVPSEVPTEAHYRYRHHARCGEDDHHDDQPSAQPTTVGAAIKKMYI